jgi:hypothetical protein
MDTCTGRTLRGMAYPSVLDVTANTYLESAAVRAPDHTDAVPANDANLRPALPFRFRVTLPDREGR